MLFTSLHINFALLQTRTVRLWGLSPAPWRTGTGTDGPVNLLLPSVEQLFDGRVGEVVKEAPDHLLRLLLPLHESLLFNKIVKNRKI